MASFDWTPDTIARLRALWDEEHATAEIGRRMGISKNAVVGKAHRLELPARPSPITRGTSGRSSPRQRRAARPTVPPLPSALTSPAAMPAIAPVVPQPPLPRRHGPSGQPCCWPLGEPGRPGFRFCGEGTAPGRPYCPEHASLAYLPSPTRDGGTTRHPPSTG
jgi:GcrA cell cycle regulator